jgi:hypothetical protein
MDSTPPSEPEDPFIEAQIERALAPYRRLLPPEDLAYFRDELLLIMETHPAVFRLVDRMRGRDVESSGKVDRFATPVPAESETRPVRAKPGGRR